MFKCPYCQQDSYAKSSKKKGKFESWKAVRAHLIKCTKNNHTYYIDSIYGSIHYTEFCNKSAAEIRNKFPNIIPPLADIRKCFYERGIDINYSFEWDKKSIINKLQEFVIKNNRIPSSKEILNRTTNISYPALNTIQKHFGSWNNAIKAAGFEPDYNDGYGNRTVAKDAVLYRSKAEAYFVDTYLYNKYKYVYEKSYDNHNKRYDFYIPDLNLYIELDGGLRPQVIEDKIIINKEEGKNLLVIKSSDIYNKKSLQEFIAG